MATAYIAKIPEFMGEDNNTSSQEWLDKVQKAGDANGWIVAKMLKAIPYFLQRTVGKWFENLEKLFENWQAFKDAFLQQFTDNNISITLRNHFYNIKQETSETFIAGLKDKLIKKVCPHAPADLAIAIRHAKSYKMAMEEANHTKLTNSQRKLKAILQTSNNSNNNHKNINHHNDATKTILDHHPTTNLKIVTIVKFQDTENKIAENYKETNKTGVINNNNNRINPNNHYLTIPEKSDFQQTALSEDEIAAPRSNPFNHTILLAQIAQNANLLDIFPFEFEANKLPFLLSNAAVNKQKAITAIYTEAIVKGKPICLILDSGSAGSIITYQLMQQLKQNVNRPAQTVIVTADGMKKTPVGEIDDFPFTIDGIIIPVKVLETQKLKISYQEQYTIVPAICSTFNKQLEKAPVFEFKEEKEMPLTETYMALGLPSNWAEETEQEIFEESKGWKKRSRKWDKTLCLTCGERLPKECNWIDVAMRGRVCDQICQYALLISEKVKRGTLFDAAYNSALNKLYHYLHDVEIIFDLAMTLINGATQEDVCQIKEAEYIEYTIELAGFDYEDKIETYYQIASHTYPTKEAQIQ
ncbi:hypothetical protein G9A89_002090 [Geosiphon pyriformis]|nr:hypothetical protein G9A89_002090 [Geosiphon pyriformis]